MRMEKNTINVRGVNFFDVDMEEALDICRGFLSEDRCHVIHTPNAEIVQLCIEQPEYYELINSADLTVPDGAGVILASKILRTPLKKGKVAGIELSENLLREAAAKSVGVFFLGGKPGVAEKAAQKMEEKYPGLRVVGCNDGFFKKVDTDGLAGEYLKNPADFKEDAAVIQKINDSGAQILLVCLGVPKQEIWMKAHRGELSVKIAGGFGGSFDIFAGEIRRAPKAFIALNLEWLYRLILEPKRIGRMMKLPKFVFGTMFSRRR